MARRGRFATDADAIRRDHHVFDPVAGAAVAGLMQDRTRAVFVESPGSLSFEMQDVPAIAAAAHARGALVLMDNTWQRRCISVRSISAWICRSTPGPNISAATPMSCSARSPPMRLRSRTSRTMLA